MTFTLSMLCASGAERVPDGAEGSRELSAGGPTVSPVTVSSPEIDPENDPENDPGSAGADDAPRKPGLSPSRAGDFLACPLLYRFRVLDKLPQRPSAAAVRGTVVHAVLERLFDLPAAERTPAAALGLVAPEWARLCAESPELAGLFAGEPDGAAQTWLAEAAALLERYYTLEDPRRLEPAARELYVETTLAGGLNLRGYIDRLDVAPVVAGDAAGDVRLVDYKTGNAPPAEFEARAMFQLKFYALVWWRLHGQVPKLLQLVYLGSGEVLRYSPDVADLVATERKVEALWTAIELATATGDWRPSPGPLCAWCDHRALCPAFGGTPPPLPGDAEPPGDELQGNRGRP